MKLGVVKKVDGERRTAIFLGFLLEWGYVLKGTTMVSHVRANYPETASVRRSPPKKKRGVIKH